ncbi:TIGR02281 family clan AA aspartic protease [Ideonella sp. B508-1]|uniref:retropepsin-like aspartic protease family protein n=1 Tax=Ideonella sp. B508-1 TaxID=137716 RepID=UPI0003B53294|nr:retropepsin-like aspartic protease [Ideonella sp. B508-1]
MRMTADVRLAVGALALVMGSAAVGESFQFFVYDGKQYGPSQIDVAAVTPAEVPAPIRQANGDYLVPRAADGHYYIGGAINGFPVVFMVDTGAKFTSVATATAANAGIRAGRAISVATAGGIERAGLSGGNTIVAGPFVLQGAGVAVLAKLDRPVLGMDVLNRFQIMYANGYMTMRSNQ